MRRWTVRTRRVPSRYLYDSCHVLDGYVHDYPASEQLRQSWHYFLPADRCMSSFVAPAGHIILGGLPPLLVYYVQEIAPSLAVSADDDDTRSRKANKVAPTAAIIGGTVVGAVCCTVAAVVVSGLLWWRRRQRGSSMNAVERSAPYIQKPSNMLGHAADDRVGELQQPAAYDGRRDQELDCNTATAMDIKSKGFINGDDYSPNLAQHQAVQQLKKGLNTSLNISFNSKQQPNNTKISGKTAACTAAADSIITPFELPPPPPPPPPPISIPPPRSSVLVGSSSKVTTTSVLHRAYMHMFQMFYRAEVNAAAGCKPQQAIISSGVAAMATSASHASNLSSLASAGPSQARRNNGIVVAAPAGSTAGAAVVRGSDDGGFMFAEGESSLIRQESGQLPRTMTTLPEMGPNSAGPTGSATASGSGELPLNGRTLNVPLTIVGELGRGAQGVVYRGIWRGLDVAVKSLLLRQEKCVMQVADAAQQLQEAAISASISHPNVVATYTYMLQPLGDELQPPSGQHNPTLADVSISKTSDHGHSNGNKLALGAAAAASVVAPLHIEVWKLTLVQELCEGNSLRHCLENGTLQTCRASRIYCAGHQQEHGGPYANPTCWAPHRLDVLRPLATLMTASPLAPAAAAADLPSTAAARAAHGGGSEGQEVSKETPPLPKLPSAAACHLDQQQQRLQQQQEPAATGHHGQQNTTSSTGSCLLQPAVMLMVALQVARGLEYLHFRGIVHGDVSSSNVLLKRAPDAVNPPSQPPVESLPSTASVRARDSWRRLPAFANGPATTVMRDPYVYGYIAKVCDFGLSGRLDSREDATHISGPARRNAAYSAPELVRDGRMSPAGDVYAFAVVLWELALGTPLSSLLQQPSRPESSGLRAWLAQQSFVELWDAEALPPDVLVWPEVARRIALAGLVEECLRAEPSARPTMTEVRKRLYGLLESLQLSE
ncbi:hypothetical protein Vretimale_11869 [Volvox reticuliferus]|uniref:Protein kinase domain-containing protein n=1 Tax=Volvox reticuliferus TaxID=1737510 RepID=A0A8J4CGE7_9CHLO|nr:hypothetical protein Vretifemale_11293 [Volvox reticuliferus]GIM07862.1 hypothetical protein Vretimale_11869 [Volvox reticuliferus]